MANSCVAWRTNLAAQTPVYDQIFLKDYKPMDSAYIGRHQTAVWEEGSGDTHFFDRITVGQPNLQDQWQRITASDCTNACNPPRTFVGMGTQRNSYFPEQKDLQSQTFCLTQLEHSTHPEAQVEEWMRKLKMLPEMYMTDFIRVHAADRADTIQICGTNFDSIVPSTAAGGNVDGMLTVIDCGSAAKLPQSELTFSYLDYLSTELDLNGYHEAESGLPDGMFNLITDKRAWFRLTNGMDSMKDMMALGDPAAASPLYRIGAGVQKPFGNYVPTLDKRPIRFQLMSGGSGGLLNRVEPYTNVAATTGTKPQLNLAYVNARYQLSYIWHPMAIKIFTKAFTKINEKIPSVVSSLFGQWQFINGQVLIAQQPDGTQCTLRNDDQTQFYWLCKLYQGFQYMYPEFIYPILHLVDGSGKDTTTNSPVCGTAPQYSAQDYTNNPTVCSA